MMKSIFALITMLFSTQVHATPAVGDLVRYKMTIENDNGEISQFFELKFEVLAVNTTIVTSNVTIFTNNEIMGNYVENSTIESESNLEHCSDMPADVATIETITVPAGTFQVCHIKSKKDGGITDEYKGNVLFGLVKSVSSNPLFTTNIELIEARKH